MQARFDSCLDGLLPGGGAVLLAVSGGIDSIVHESETDMITGDIRTFVGIRCDHPDRKDAFQALVIALPSRSAEMPQENEDVVYAVKHQIYSRMQTWDLLGR